MANVVDTQLDQLQLLGRLLDEWTNSRAGDKRCLPLPQLSTSPTDYLNLHHKRLDSILVV